MTGIMCENTGLHIISKDVDSYIITFLTPDDDFTIRTIQTMSLVSKKFANMLDDKIKDWNKFRLCLIENSYSEKELMTNENFASSAAYNVSWIAKYYITDELFLIYFRRYFTDCIQYSSNTQTIEYLLSIVDRISIKNKDFEKAWIKYIVSHTDIYMPNTTIHIINFFCHTSEANSCYMAEENIMYLLNTDSKYIPMDNFNPLFVLDFAIKRSYKILVKKILSTYDIVSINDLLKWNDYYVVKNSQIRRIIEYYSWYDPEILDILEQNAFITYDFRPYFESMIKSYPGGQIIKHILFLQEKRNEIYDQTSIITLMKKVCSKTADKDFLEYLVNYGTKYNYQINRFNIHAHHFIQQLYVGSITMIEYMIELRNQYHPGNPYNIWECFEQSIRQRANDNIRVIIDYLMKVDPHIEQICNTSYDDSLIYKMIYRDYCSDDILYIWTLCSQYYKWSASEKHEMMTDACHNGKLSLLKHLIEVETLPFNIHAPKSLIITAMDDLNLDMWNYLIDLSISDKSNIFYFHDNNIKSRPNEYSIHLFLEVPFIERLFELLNLPHHTRKLCIHIRKLIKKKGYDSLLPIMDEIIQSKT